MGQARNWTRQEKEYLEENWGTVSIPYLAKKLNRSKGAVILKAQKLGCGAFLQSGDYVSFNQVVLALGINGGTGYLTTSWIKNRNFPCHTKQVKNNKFRVVYIDEFWKWGEENQTLLDFSKFDENSLGVEPEWAKNKRKKDCLHNYNISKLPWSPLEDQRLKRLLREWKYTYRDISKLMKRTEGAIQRRICDLGLKERPIKADNHIKWTDSEYETLAKLINAGERYEQMSEILGKSVKAIRGRVYQMYLTENLDKVRKIMAGGQWGTGRPERPIGKFLLMNPDEKIKTKMIVSNLTYILLNRAKAISPVGDEYKDFWQKDMCQNWDDVHGCTAGEQNCDSCMSFIRIQPQFCRCCGGTFYERKENAVCKKCRNMRLFQARKKYAILNSRGR